MPTPKPSKPKIMKEQLLPDCKVMRETDQIRFTWSDPWSKYDDLFDHPDVGKYYASIIITPAMVGQRVVVRDNIPADKITGLPLDLQKLDEELKGGAAPSSPWRHLPSCPNIWVP